MKKGYVIYLIIFLAFIFGSNIDNIIISLDPNLTTDNILENYDVDLKNNYQNLLDMHNIKINNDYNLLITKVKFRDMYDFDELITIYKGFDDNIFPGSVVLDTKGLLGVVKRTFSHSSKVQLISSKNSNISVKINDSYGILKSVDKKLVVKELSNYEKINIGDLIYTSGYGNLKSGIYIGKVKSINLNNTEIEKIIEVEPSADLNNINYVFIYGDKNV